MINCSEDSCSNCSAMPDGRGTSPHLLWYAVIHCYAVLFLGIICNSVALWCIVTCTKTQPAVKVLLCSMFATTLLMCVLMMPFNAEVVLAELWCDPGRISRAVWVGFSILYTLLAEMELFYIASVAFLRAAAAWSLQRHTVELLVVVALVISICVYHVLLVVGLLGPLWLGYVTENRSVIVCLSVLYCCLNTLLPILLTMACYCSMLLAVRRNKLRLASSQHNTVSHVVDQATRATLAVFFSNLLFGLPHTLYHLLDAIYQFFNSQSDTSYLIVHMIFFVHIVVDPVVFVWFNHNHRQQVGELLRVGLDKIEYWSSPHTAAPANTLEHSVNTQSSMNRRL